MTIKCLIVDDEPLAIRLIKKHLERFDQFEIVDECENAIDAFRTLQKTNIDLIFLDIQMPEISGIDFLKSLHKKPQVIITSAYKEYAIDGFELDVVDFLLKPISFNRFFKAINKFLALNSDFEKINSEQKKSYEKKDEYEDLHIKDANKIYRINPVEILYIEGMREYIKIFTIHENIVTKTSLINFLKILPDKLFLRVHKSYIVNIEKVRAFTASSIEINNHKIPIGRSYKINAMEVLKSD